MTIKKGYIDTTDGQVHYRVCQGPGSLPLVCLHQTASSSQMYENLMETLHGQYRVFVLDTPGFGQSFVPPQVPTWLLRRDAPRSVAEPRYSSISPLWPSHGGCDCV